MKRRIDIDREFADLPRSVWGTTYHEPPFEVCGVISSLGSSRAFYERKFPIMISKLLGKRGRPPEQIQVGGYDNPIKQQFPGHEMVSLEDSKPLPVQLVRESGQDNVMGDGDMSSSSENQLARQDDVILNAPRQDNMLSRQQQQNLPEFATLAASRRGVFHKGVRTCVGLFLFGAHRRGRGGPNLCMFVLAFHTGMDRICGCNLSESVVNLCTCITVITFMTSSIT